MIGKAGPTPEGKEEAAPYQRIGREGFDENVYQQVKPVIQKVYNDSVANKRTIKDFITTLHARYGNQIRPYVKRFVKDLRTARAIERLTRNAYRVLGLHASASQAAIHNAAGSMRRALKLGAAKTTAWDLCWLGALNRAESDIQDAVGRLTNPTQRLYERLFWFHEGEDVVRGLSLASLENTAAGWSSAPRPAARHDAAVVYLLAAVLLDPEVKKESLWLGVFSEWKLVVKSDDYWSALIDAEMTSDFEPTATVEEVEKVREETLRLVANILVVIARDALTRDELALCQRTFHVFQMAGLSDDHLSDLENEILEPVEDSFEALCTEVRRQCSDNMRRDDKSAQTNRLVCEPAVARFDTEVEPQLKRIVELAGSDSAVGRRARESAARCLHSLAIDWEWTYDWIGAESLLLRGRALAGDTSAAVRFDEELERIAAFVPRSAKARRMTPQDKLRKIREELQQLFLERAELIDGALAALLAAQHILIIGPPGTAKSMLADELCRRITGATYFQWLLTKFTTPEELFGAVSLKALEADDYRRVTVNKLPEAHIAFLDEVFKASSSLNAILTIINERLFHNGRVVVSVPLLTLFGASNELPEDDELLALSDRFLLRFVVAYIGEEFRFLKMLQAKEPAERTTITLDELRQMQVEVQTLPVPTLVLRGLADIRRELQKKNIIASDRRYRQSLGLLQALAYLHGRTAVAESDLFFLEHVLWKEPSERVEVHNVIHGLIHGYEDEVQELLFQTRELRDYAERAWDNKEQRARAVIEAHTKIRHILAKVEEISQKARDVGRPLDKVATIRQEIHVIQQQLLAKF